MEQSEKDEKEESWGSQSPPVVTKEAIAEARKKAAEFKFDTGGTVSTESEALKILQAPTNVKCPSGVTYSFKKVSAEAMALLFTELGSDTESYQRRSLEMLGQINKFTDIIYEHIILPKVDKDMIPGGDWAHLLTFMIFEVSGVGEGEEEDRVESFREQ